VAIEMSWRFGCPPPILRVGGQGIATKATDSKSSSSLNLTVLTMGVFFSLQLGLHQEKRMASCQSCSEHRGDPTALTVRSGSRQGPARNWGMRMSRLVPGSPARFLAVLLSSYQDCQEASLKYMYIKSIT
jgi:hypothetical protein